MTFTLLGFDRSESFTHIISTLFYTPRLGQMNLQICYMIPFFPRICGLSFFTITICVSWI